MAMPQLTLEAAVEAPCNSVTFEIRRRTQALDSVAATEKKSDSRPVDAEAAKKLLEERLPLIQKLLANAGRRYALSPQDRDDFQSYSFVKLIDNDYRILRRFEGRSNLRSNLKVVVVRLALDYLDHRFGKWRPSAAAKHLGDAAKILEMLLYRDGLSEDEAIEYLKINHRRPETRRELRILASGLASRTKRGEDTVGDFEWLAVEPNFEHDADAGHRRRQTLKLQRSVQQAIDQLDPDTRQVMAWRFRDGLTARAIAERVGRPQRSIYTQVEKGVRQLRRCLTASRAAQEQFMALTRQERSGLFLCLTS